MGITLKGTKYYEKIQNPPIPLNTLCSCQTNSTIKYMFLYRKLSHLTSYLHKILYGFFQGRPTICEEIVLIEQL